MVKMTMVTTGKDGSPITSNVFSTKKFDDPMRLGWRVGDGWWVVMGDDGRCGDDDDEGQVSDVRAVEKMGGWVEWQMLYPSNDDKCRFLGDGGGEKPSCW